MTLPAVVAPNDPVASVWGNDVRTALLERHPLGVTVLSYGAVGDGTADDTTAIQDAIDDAIIGGAVFLPPFLTGGSAAVYKFSNLTLSGGKHLTGGGFYIRRDSVGVFGDSNYATGSFFGGTVLRSTATSGVAITHLGSTHFQGGVRDLILIGPGSGTSVGIAIGSSSIAVLRGIYSNVMVCNFATGVTMEQNNECSFYDLATRGCTTGVEFVADVNSNQFYGLDVQRSTNGLVMTGDDSLQCTFIGPIFQNVSGVGATLRGQSHVFVNSYFEYPTAPFTTFDLQSADHCQFIGVDAHGAAATLEVRSGSRWNRFQGLVTHANHVVNNAGTGNSFEGYLTNLTDTGSNTRIFDLNGTPGIQDSWTVRTNSSSGGATQVLRNAGTGTSSAALQFGDLSTLAWQAYKQNADTRLYFRDLVNSRQHMYLHPGASNTAAVTVMNSSLVVGSTVQIGASGPTWTSGTGSPESVVTASVGSIFSRTNGGAGTSFYVKESGAGNTGWVAK